MLATPPVDDVNYQLEIVCILSSFCKKSKILFSINLFGDLRFL